MLLYSSFYIKSSIFFSSLLFSTWYKTCLYEERKKLEIETKNSTLLKFKIFNISSFKTSKISKSNSKSIVNETSNYRILARILKFQIFIFFKSISRNLEFPLKNVNVKTNVDLNRKATSKSIEKINQHV